MPGVSAAAVAALVLLISHTSLAIFTIDQVSEQVLLGAVVFRERAVSFVRQLQTSLLKRWLHVFLQQQSCSQDCPHAFYLK